MLLHNRKIVLGAVAASIPDLLSMVNLQVGTVLVRSYGGRAATLVKKAQRSAVRLVDLIAASFPGFRDQTVYQGKQICFYKRAQIFVADVFGAFQGKGLGRFDDMSELTMFADYRVPVVLERLGGILHLDPALKQRVRSFPVLGHVAACIVFCDDGLYRQCGRYQD